MRRGTPSVARVRETCLPVSTLNGSRPIHERLVPFDIFRQFLVKLGAHIDRAIVSRSVLTASRPAGQPQNQRLQHKHTHQGDECADAQHDDVSRGERHGFHPGVNQEMNRAHHDRVS